MGLSESLEMATRVLLFIEFPTARHLILVIVCNSWIDVTQETNIIFRVELHQLLTRCPMWFLLFKANYTHT